MCVDQGGTGEARFFNMDGYGDCDMKLDSVAEGVEKSRCVLMCVPDKYKEDTKRRSEAEDAFLVGNYPTYYAKGLQAQWMAR